VTFPNQANDSARQIPHNLAPQAGGNRGSCALLQFIGNRSTPTSRHICRHIGRDRCQVESLRFSTAHSYGVVRIIHVWPRPQSVGNRGSCALLQFIGNRSTPTSQHICRHIGRERCHVESLRFNTTTRTKWCESFMFGFVSSSGGTKGYFG